MSFLDRLVKHGLVHTMSGSSNNGAFPVTEQDIIRYQKELATAQDLQLQDRANRRGLGSIGHRRNSSSSSSCGSFEDCIIVDQRGLHSNRCNNNTSQVNEPVAETGISTNNANDKNNKMRTSSYDDEIDLIKYSNSGCTFDMSLLPRHDPTTTFTSAARDDEGRWSLDESSEQHNNNSAHNRIEFTLDEMNHHQDGRGGGGGEDNVLLLCRAKKRLTVRGKAKQVILKPLRSGWCFVKSLGERVRKWQREHQYHETAFGRRGKQRRNFDPTASLDDDDYDQEVEDLARTRVVEDSEEMVEFEKLPSRSGDGGDDDLLFSTGIDHYNDDQGFTSSKTHSSR